MVSEPVVGPVNVGWLAWNPETGEVETGELDSLREIMKQGKDAKAVILRDEWHALHDKYTALQRENAELREMLKRWKEDVAIDVPDPNCACHIHAPCYDCVNYSHLRELDSETRTLLARKEGDDAKE